MAKGRTRKITRKAALSYRRTTPNPIGVRAIASVNGKSKPAASRARAIRTRWHAYVDSLSAAQVRAAAAKGKPWAAKELRHRGLKPNQAAVAAAPPAPPPAATPNRKKKRKMSPAQKRALAKGRAALKAKLCGVKAPAKKRARKNGHKSAAYRRRYAATKRLLKNRGRAVLVRPILDIDDTSSASTKMSSIRRTSMAGKKKGKKGAKKSGKKLKGAAFKRSAQYKKMQAGRKRWLAKQGKKGGRKSAPKASKKGRKRSAAKTSIRRLTASIGGKSFKTYLYKTKGGKVKKMPRYAVLGFKSLAAMRKASNDPKRGPAIGRRASALNRARQRAAARVLKHGDAFTPNTSVIPYSEWSDTMKANKRKGKKSGKKGKGRRRKGQTAAQRKASLKNLRKARAARKGGRKAAKRSSSRRKGGGRKSAKRVAAGRKAARTRARNKAGRKPTRRGKGRRRSLKGARLLGRVGKKRIYVANRGRRARRYTANQWVDQLKAGLKIGGLIVGGFLAHKALSKVLADEVLSKVDALNTPSVAPYRSLLAGAIVAAAGIPLAVKFLPQGAKPIVAGGIAASLLHAGLIVALTKMGQDKAAGYLAAYPDAEGRAYAYGAYELVPGMSGYGEYMAMQGFGAPITQAAAGYGQITQAAAGYGQITQAAAGYGAAPMLTQAAAGVGEFMLTGASGYGDYEMVSGVGQSDEYMDEGIQPDLASAERALNIAEAAAGVGAFGDIGLQSTLNPEMIAQPVEDVPMGMRSGILEGGDGIFG